MYFMDGPLCVTDVNEINGGDSFLPHFLTSF